MPKDVSPTGMIGRYAQSAPSRATSSVIVAYQLSGKAKTTTLSVAALFQQFVRKGSVIEFKVDDKL